MKVDHGLLQSLELNDMPISEVYNEDNMIGMARYPDKFYDLAVVDPPYGIERLSVNENREPNSKFRRSMSKMVDSAKKWNSQKPSMEYFNELFRVSKEQIIWGANNFTLPESEYFLIWDKMQTVSNFASAEYAWVSMNNWRKPAKVFRYQIHAANAVEDKIHPTMKPTKLYKWILQNYAQPGDKILDTHMGSQSSRIASYLMGFDYWGWEIDKEYFKAGNKRFKEQTAQLKLL